MSSAPLVPSLLCLCLDAVCKAIDQVEDLSGLAEDLVVDIFSRTLAAGKLTPRLVQVFAGSGHDTIVSALQVKPSHQRGREEQAASHLWWGSRAHAVLPPTQALNLREPPPLFDDTPNPWLGEHRRLS